MLVVRAADPDTAWLRLPAAAPAADDEAAAPQLGWCGGGSISAASAPPRRLEFACLEDALEAAADGDRVVLLPGTHNVRAPHGLTLAKRVVIEGAAPRSAPPPPALHSQQEEQQQQRPNNSAGAPAPATPTAVAVIDFRGNSPLFCIERSCVLRDFEVDMVGFAPAVLVDADSARVAPLLSRVRVACSGDDALSVGGRARATLAGCERAGRKAGARGYGRCELALRGCLVRACGAQGVLLQESALARLERCAITGCADEGVAVSGAARCELRGCAIDACGAPAVDASGSAQVQLIDCALRGCVGGLWMWDTTHAHAERTIITAAASFAVLLDAAAHAVSGGCNVVDGPVMLAEPSGGGGGGVGGGSGGGDEAAARRLPRKASLLRGAAVEAAAAAAAAAATQGGGSNDDSEDDGSSDSSSSSATAAGAVEALVLPAMALKDPALRAAAFPPEAGAFADPAPTPLGL